MTDPVHRSGLPWMRLDARVGWGLLERGGVNGAPSGLDVSDGIALGTPGRRPIADTEAFGSFGGRRLPRALAIGSDGAVFLADPVGRVILVTQAGVAKGDRPDDAPATWPFVPLWPARPRQEAPWSDPYALERPVAVALAPNGDLVIADAGAGRVLVLALPSARLRHIIRLDEPVAVSFDRMGRAYVADAGAGTVARFDRLWRRDRGYPHRSVPRITGIEHLAHAAGTRPSSDAGACRDGTGCDDPDRDPGPDLYLIARGRLHALTMGGSLWSALPAEDPLPEVALSDAARLTPPALDLSADGALSWRDPAWPARDPLPLHGIAVDRSGRLDGSQLPLLARPRRIELPLSGRAGFAALDGGREGFVWDRIVLTAEVPERTRLLVSTFATDAVLEPPQVQEVDPSAWSPALEIGPGVRPEIAVQGAGGRHLWIRLELFGDGSRTPRVTAVEVFGPRVSSLASLPAPYHQDPESASFLDRFLGYFDTVFAEVVEANARTPALFDPRSVPTGPFLEWLASWFDITFLPRWPEATRRTMVARAVAMYRKRGTVPGLRQMLQWHTGLAEPMPAVIERFRVSAPLWIGGQPLEAAEPTHAVTIVLPTSVVPDDDARRLLDKVIAAAAPAHVRVDLRLIRPGIAIGRQSTLGVDMLIGSLGPAPLAAGRLGADLLFPLDPHISVQPTDQREPRPC
jgi:phage tail-like protein